MTNINPGTESPQDAYWFNTKTGEVEYGKQSLSLYRIGPFATAEDAKNAPEILAQRSRQWAEEDADEAEDW